MEKQAALVQSAAKTANSKFKQGIETYKSAKTAGGVFSLFYDLILCAVDAVTLDIGSTISDAKNFFGEIEELGQLETEMKEINKLQASLAISIESASFLPENRLDMDKFVVQSSEEGFSEELFSGKTLQAFLNLTVFNRSEAIQLIEKYDSLTSTVELLMKASIDNEIDGALEVTIAIKKLCVVGKTVTNARIGRVSALSGFAKRMYQMITDRRLSKMLEDSESSVVAKFFSKRRAFVDKSIPASYHDAIIVAGQSKQTVHGVLVY